MTAKQWKNPPPLTIDAQRIYQAQIETDKGTIKVDLYAQHAPQPQGQQRRKKAKVDTLGL